MNINNVSDRALAQSLKSAVCPACADPKKVKHAVCRACWDQLSGKAQRGLHKRFGDGYAQAVRSAFAELDRSRFHEPEPAEAHLPT